MRLPRRAPAVFLTNRSVVDRPGDPGADRRALDDRRGGAHSLVRSTLDLTFEGHTRAEDYALGDLKIDGALADTDFHIFSSEHGFMGLFPMGGDHFRLIASNPISEPTEGTAPSLDELQTIYDQRSPIPARFHDLTWSSWFRINSRMVSRLRIGRLFLGGDAAHIHSPAGAQGMNTGIQDMINLCWKLAMVTRGEAPPALLDTYEADRLPVMRGVLKRTDSLTTTIGAENSVVRSLVNHLSPLIGGADFVQENATAQMSQIALGYHDSPLSKNYRHSGALRAGDRIPDMPVRRRMGAGWIDAYLHETLDPSHVTLLVAVAPTAVCPADVRSLVPNERAVEIAAPLDGACCAKAFGDVGLAILVRPDGYAGLVCPLTDAAEHICAFRAEWFKPAARQ